MNNVQKVKMIVLTVCVAVAAFFAAERWISAQKAPVETAGQKFKSIKVLNDMPADQMGKVMNMISASLGVNCSFCHASNDGDYEKEGIEHKDTARKMMKMVFDLNKSQFNGRPEINCNSCHRGISHPQPSFPLVAGVPPEERPKQPEKKPTVDEILTKYEAAIGGKPNLDKVTSRMIKANRIEADGKTVEAETIWIKPNKYVSDTEYGAVVVRETYDGTAGHKFSNTDPVELKPDEVEQIKREAELFWPGNLKATYPKMDYRSVERINGREVYSITTTTAGNLRERLYFDVMTGLLVRRTATSPTVFGTFVFQVDYSDYKNFGGVKLPTTTHYSVPHISWTRKIQDVKTNVPVDDTIFGVPSKKK